MEQGYGFPRRRPHAGTSTLASAPHAGAFSFASWTDARGVGRSKWTSEQIPDGSQTIDARPDAPVPDDAPGLATTLDGVASAS